MRNILKVVFLGVVGFTLLVFLTLPEKNRYDTSILTLDNLPNYYELVNGDKFLKKDEMFKELPITIVVLNHDSLAVFKDFENRLGKNIIFVANISNTPWLFKKIAVESELDKMFKYGNNIVINDSKGEFVKALRLNDNSMNSYFIYEIKEDKSIKMSFKNSVKMGALQDGISKEEVERELLKFEKLFEK